MLIELKEVSPLTRVPTGAVQVNPAHVVLVRPFVNAQDPDAQAFVTQITLVVGGTLTVEGPASQVRQTLNVGSLR